MIVVTGASGHLGRLVIEGLLEEARAVPTGAGLLGFLANLYVDADVQAAQGELDDAGGQPLRLIGRATTPLADAVAAALRR
jgi:NAD(P)H dehydrogenase (quinone)